MSRSSRKLATVVSVLALGLSLVFPAPARAANSSSASVQTMGAPTVLGIEKSSDADEQAAFDLTEALRAEMEARGKGGGADLSLLELRLTMGCEGNDNACLAEGGKTLDADELIYGQVVGTPAGYRVELSRLEVGSGTVVGSTNQTVDTERFGSAEALAALAKDLLDVVYGIKEPPPPAPIPGTPEAAAAAAAENDDPSAQSEDGGGQNEVKADTSNLVWGRDPNPPKWKWIGLGVSAGLAVASLGTAIGTTVAIGPNGSATKKLHEAADDSLTDSVPTNDVDRRLVDDICAYAREEINPVSEPGAVRNKDVTDACNRGDALATTATVTWITTGVFLVSTAAFTTLLFVRKKDDRAARLLREHDVSVGGAPTPDGGFVMGGAFSF